MIDYELFISELEIKGFQAGLTKKDYADVKYYLQKFREEMGSLDPNSKNYQYLKSLEISLSTWEQTLRRYFFTKIHPNNIEYLRKNTSLLPLVYTNFEQETIRLYSDDGFMFSCQFHVEKTPSMGVTNSNNLFYCYGCGASGNQFNYLMDYENMSFIDSVYLLAQIYLIPFPNNPFDENNLIVKKYQSTFMNDDFVELLQRGIARVNQRGGGAHYLSPYYNLLDQIKRIREHQVDKNFHYTKKKKRLKLEIPL